MSLYQQILDESKKMDARWRGFKDVETAVISFNVPENHSRYSVCKSYTLKIFPLSKFEFRSTDLVIADKNITASISEASNVGEQLILESSENKVKTLKFLDPLISGLRSKSIERVVGIGGGLILNVASYIAEQLKTDLIFVPTSVIAMADGSMGGKVRVNGEVDDKLVKHNYKSFYEPTQIFLDPSFLLSLNNEQIQTGMSEIIKHALYQSEELAQFLLRDEFEPFTNRQSLLKAILWTADLKRVCLYMDPEESAEGSYRILRAAHDISDQIEEDSNLTIAHGQAVLKAMHQDLLGKPQHELLRRICSKTQHFF